MKKFIVFLAVAIDIPCLAQEVTYQHSISGELLGLGAIGISVQYDYMFGHSTHGFFDTRLGVGGWYFNNVSDAGVTIPHAFTYNFGKKHHYFEGGIGGIFGKEYDWSYESYSKVKYFAGPMFGYRSISQKGFQFRFYVNAFFNAQGFAYPSAGIGVGKALRKNN